MSYRETVREIVQPTNAAAFDEAWDEFDRNGYTNLWGTLFLAGMIRAATNRLGQRSSPRPSIITGALQMTDKANPEFDKIVQLWAGGEHLRAAALAAEQKFPEAKLEDLSILCPGIKDHMPADPGTVKDKGTVPGDPVQSEMDRMRVDEEQVGDINRQRKEEGKSPKQALAEADLKPSGTPRNDGKDGPTLHPKHGHKK